MAKIIPLPIQRPRLPRRLLNDGWWLESKPARSVVVAFPPRDQSRPKPGSLLQRRHLTLVISEK
jgi:hypothetical protein